MELKRELLEAAEVRAHSDGRNEMSLVDLLAEAFDRSRGRLRMLGTMSRFELEGVQHRPASEPELDEVFHRASALAVALDQPFAAEHVVAILGRLEDVLPPGVIGMVGQMALQVVAGPDEEQQAQMLEDMQKRAPQRQGPTGFELHTVSSDGMQTGDAAARCPRCGHDLDEGLEAVTVAVGDSNAGAIVCKQCRTIVGIRSS